MRKKRIIRNLVAAAAALAICACGYTLLGRGAWAVDNPSENGYTMSDPGAMTYPTGVAMSITAGATAPNQTFTCAWTAGGDLSGTSTTATFTPTVSTAATGTGTVQCVVSYDNGGVPATVTLSRTITVNKASRTISITNLVTGIDAGSAHQLNYSVSAGASDGTVSWAGTVNNTGAAGAVTFTGGNISATATGAEGSVSGIIVSISAGNNYLAADSGTGQTVTVNLKNPNLAITPTSISMKAGETGKNVSASSGAGSTGTITYGVENPNPAGCVTLSNTTTVNGVSAGAAVVRASIGKAWPYAAATADCAVTVGLNTPTTKLTGDVALALGATTTKTVTDKQGTGAVAYTLSGVTPAGCITLDTATGELTAVNTGRAVMSFTQAADTAYAAVSDQTYKINVTVSAPVVAIDKSTLAVSVGGTGTAVLSAAGVPAGGTVNIISSDASIATVSPATATGSGNTTITITGVKAGTATIKASYLYNGTEYKDEMSVTASLPATYFAMYSWYDYLNRSYPTTEVTAIQVNPLNTMGPQATTYWYVENPSVLKLVWSTGACYYESGSYKSRCEVKALRNGTTRVVVRTGDAQVGYTYGYYTITVTGYSYIPQTGPDDTPIFVLEGLLALTLLSAAGVALYQQRKKRMNERP